jgi:hypothetical protein
MGDSLEPQPESNNQAIVVIMNKVIRQTDPNFRDVLQNARDGTMDDGAVDFYFVDTTLPQKMPYF